MIIYCYVQRAIRPFLSREFFILSAIIEYLLCTKQYAQCTMLPLIFTIFCEALVIIYHFHMISRGGLGNLHKIA